MNKNKLIKIFCVVLMLLFAFIAIYMVIGASSDDIIKQYDAVKPESDSGFSKAIAFLRSYVQSTGDTTVISVLGLSDEDASYVTGTTYDNEEESETEESSTVTDPDPNEDLREYAKMIAKTFTCSKSGWEGKYCYFMTNGHSGNNYVPQHDNESRTGGDSKITINGCTFTTTHRDCSCFVSALTVYYTGTFVHKTSSTISELAVTNVTSTVTTAADLQVGDILWKPNHVAMVVYKDGNTVHIGDCGNNERIEDTATRGYVVDRDLSYSTAMSSTIWEKVYRQNNK